MRKTLTLLALSLMLFLTACAETVEEELQGTPTGQFKAEFDPSNAVVPFPTNLLFSGSTDGTLNIPLSGDASDGPKIAMNALDGFSTVAPITTTFSIAIDPSPASINGNTVRLWEVTSDPATKAVVGFVAALTFGVDYFATVSSTDTSGRTLAILPLKPLKPASTYLIILTNGLLSTDGQVAGPSQTYLSARIPNPVVDAQGNSLFPSFTNEQAQALEPLRQLTNLQDAVMNGVEPGLPDKAVLAWAFSTQSVGKVLQAAHGLVAPAVAMGEISSTITNTVSPVTTPSGKADIYVGTITLPYYLSVPSVTAPTAPLNTHWEAENLFPPVVGTTNLTALNPIPKKTTDVTIPLLISIPKAAKPAQGWKIAIYQHGLERDRSTMLFIADALADRNIAAVAIDVPLHGLTDTNDPLFMAGLERTFNMDFVKQDPNTEGIIGTGPDGITDSSGRHFVNLTSLLTLRDNIRQAVADLFALTAEIPNMDFDGDGFADFDGTEIFFIGHSGGGIVGTPFLANEPDVKQSVLASTAGGLAKFNDGSAVLGPELAAGLAAAGIFKGTSEYEAFLGAYQTVVDSADPINYALAATKRGPMGPARGLMMHEVVGDGAANLPDQTVPNHVGTFANGFTDAPVGTVPGPLSGTDPLAREMTLEPVSGTSSDAGFVSEALPWLSFTAGDHRSFFDPTSNPVVTTVMQDATVDFLEGGGVGFDISAIPSVPGPGTIDVRTILE